MIRFRRARISDLRIVSSWIHSAEDCRFWAGDKMPYPIDPARLPEIMEISRHDSRTLLREGSPAGFGQIVQRPENRLHLARIIISPQYRGKGMGRRLVEYLLRRAISRKPVKISLNVSRDNPVAIRLYESLGFVIVALPGVEPQVSYYYMEYMS